jgi:tetratricopeptide (TPR) repeat protein
MKDQPGMKTSLFKAPMWLLLNAGLASVCAMAQPTSPLVEVRSLMEAGRLPEAGKEIGRQLQRPDPEPGMQLLQCVVQAQQNQTEKAIACLKALVKQHPDMLEAYNNLGVLYASMNQQEESKRWFTLALQRQPTLWTLHQNLQSLQADMSRKAYARALQTELPLKDTAPKLTLLAATSIKNAPTSRDTHKAPDASVVAKAPADAQTPMAVIAHAPTQASVLKDATAKSAHGGLTPSDTGSVKTGKATALEDTTRQQVQEAVQAWAQAWRTQNMPVYLAAYTPDYTPGEGTTRPAWEAERTERIVGRQFIRVKVSNFTFENTGTKVIARFTQIYESDNIQSTRRKRLEFVHLEGLWKIARETVISN